MRPQTKTAATGWQSRGSGHGEKSGEISHRHLNRNGIPMTRETQYVRMNVVNDDLHVVGFELIRLGPDLRSYIRKMAAEGGAR